MRRNAAGAWTWLTERLHGEEGAGAGTRGLLCRITSKLIVCDRVAAIKWQE
jgi:hypothetical protein